MQTGPLNIIRNVGEMMPNWDKRDFFGGALLMALGGFFAVYAAAKLPLGSFTRMGPGMIPTVLGSLLVIIGLTMSIAAMLRKGPRVLFDGRVAVFVLCSILAFSFLISAAGLVPAVTIQILIVSRADAKLGLGAALALAAALSASAAGLFKYGLGVPMKLISWPW